MKEIGQAIQDLVEEKGQVTPESEWTGRMQHLCTTAS